MVIVLWSWWDSSLIWKTH